MAIAGVLVLAVAFVGAAEAGGPVAVWPGGPAVSIADGKNVFGKNLSGLAYEPSGSSAPGVLWAVRNSPSTLFRLVRKNGIWKPATSNGWSNGKQLHYPGGGGAPDAEGVTLAGGDAGAVYVSAERDGSGTSRPSVLRYDVTGGGASLTATDDFNLSADLPGLGDNLGLEAIAWVPDTALVSKGFVDEGTNAAYSPASHANHGSGLFFVGIEQTGQIIAYALDPTTDSYSRVATIASGFPAVMDLEYEPESTHLWAACDNTCSGQHNVLDVAQAGANDGKYVVTAEYKRPPEMPNLNNEGFALAPAAECSNGLKPAIWSDDDNDDKHALREGTVKCGPAGPDTRVDGHVTAAKTQKQGRKEVSVATRVSTTEKLNLRATGAIKVGGHSYATKRVTRSLSAGALKTVTVKPAKAKDARAILDRLAGGKTAKAKISVRLTDTAGNQLNTPLSVKLKR